jgi:transforming growth factor-beta-induced protein
MTFKTFRNLVPAIVATLFLAACSDNVSALEESADLQASAKKETAAGQQSQDIVDIALGVNADSGEFSFLIEALTRVDLVPALQSQGQFTVFAPTDSAFLNLVDELENVDSLDDLDDETLTKVLLYHVVNGRGFANSVLSKRQLTTLSGDKLFVSKTPGTAAIVDVNGRQANILVDERLFDIPASNGVIHVIDRVVLPEL